MYWTETVLPFFAAGPVPTLISIYFRPSGNVTVLPLTGGGVASACAVAVACALAVAVAWAWAVCFAAACCAKIRWYCQKDKLARTMTTAATMMLVQISRRRRRRCWRKMRSCWRCPGRRDFCSVPCPFCVLFPFTVCVIDTCSPLLCKMNMAEILSSREYHYWPTMTRGFGTAFTDFAEYYSPGRVLAE